MAKIFFLQGRVAFECLVLKRLSPISKAQEVEIAELGLNTRSNYTVCSLIRKDNKGNGEFSKSVFVYE